MPETIKNFIHSGNSNEVGAFAKPINKFHQTISRKAARVCRGMFKERRPLQPSNFGRSEIHHSHENGECERVTVQRLSFFCDGNQVLIESSADMKENQLQRKIELCKNLIEVYDKVDPGETNQRTNIVFELCCATIVATKNKVKRNLTKKNEGIVRET
jgi:hypothetical protein